MVGTAAPAWSLEEAVHFSHSPSLSARAKVSAKGPDSSLLLHSEIIVARNIPCWSVCFLFLLFFFLSTPLFSRVSLISLPPLFFRHIPCVTLTINPSCISAIPTEVGAFLPWGNGPSPAQGSGLLQRLPSAGDRHHMAELLHLLCVGEFLLWLLLPAQRACCGAIQGCGCADCSVLQEHNREGRGDGETHPTLASQSFVSPSVSSHVSCMGALTVIFCIY